MAHTGKATSDIAFDPAALPEAYSNPNIHTRVTRYTEIGKVLHGDTWDPATAPLSGEAIMRAGGGKKHDRYWLGDNIVDTAFGMGLYPTCRHSVCNIEFIHICYAILIVYQSMLCLFMSYMKHVVWLDDMGKDIDLLCFWACYRSLLIHPKGGRTGEARVVTSYTGVVLGYVGSSDMKVPHGVAGVSSWW